MSDYRRFYQEHSSYFFTVVTHQRRRVFEHDSNIARLRRSFQFVSRKRPFGLDAIVVLPDHIHCIWTLGTDTDYSLRWRMIKTHFSRFTATPDNRAKRRRVWQPRFWEHCIRNREDYERHLHYIHFNPVKHGYVSRPADWPHSSFRKFVRMGWYPEDWGQSQPELIGGMNPE